METFLHSEVPRLPTPPSHRPTSIHYVSHTDASESRRHVWAKNSSLTATWTTSIHSLNIIQELPLRWRGSFFLLSFTESSHRICCGNHHNQAPSLEIRADNGRAIGILSPWSFYGEFGVLKCFLWSCEGAFGGGAKFVLRGVRIRRIFEGGRGVKEVLRVAVVDNSILIYEAFS